MSDLFSMLSLFFDISLSPCCFLTHYIFPLFVSLLTFLSLLLLLPPIICYILLQNCTHTISNIHKYTVYVVSVSRMEIYNYVITPNNQQHNLYFYSSNSVQSFAVNNQKTFSEYLSGSGNSACVVL